MDKFEFYKELYHKENDRKSEITNSFRIPVVIISALASGFFFLLTSYTFKIFPYLDWIFICLLSLTVISILISCYSMIRAFNIFKSFEYKGIPQVNELENWYDELFKYYNKSPKKSDNDFIKGITNHFIESVQFNTYINDRKHGFIYKSKQYSAIGLIFLFLSFAPYFIIYFSKSKSINKSEFVLEEDYSKDIITLNIKIDSLTKTINKLKTENMCAKKKSTPPPAPKVRTYSEGGKIPVPKPTIKSK